MDAEVPLNSDFEIGQIEVGQRFRRNLGDLSGLVKSIQSVGLLHPIVVRPDGVLIAGLRRLGACKELGWNSVPVHIVDVKDVIQAEHDENVVRKDFLPSEAVAIWQVMEGYSGRGKPSKLDGFKIRRDRAAEFTKLGKSSLSKARQIVEAADRDPEKYRVLVEKMDSTGRIDPVFKELRKRQKEEAKAKVPDDLLKLPERCQLIHGDFVDAVKSISAVDSIITDPPYAEKYLPLYESLARVACTVLKPGGSLLVLTGQSYLPEILKLMTPYIRYHWTIAYLTPGGQSPQMWSRNVNAFWKPVLWFVNGDYKGDWIGDVVTSDINDNDKRYHRWGQSESGMVNLVSRFSYPGDTILDTFLGGGTTGFVSVKMNRCFIGIDIDEKAIETSRKRIVGIETE